MTQYAPFCPVDLHITSIPEGESTIRSLLPNAGCSLLVMTPHTLCATLSLSSFFASLKADGHNVHLLTDIPTNPSVSDLISAISTLHSINFTPQRILAIGGGSCIDLAKGISAFWHMPPRYTSDVQNLRKAIEQKTYISLAHPFVDVLAMPTTAGTGSEVTHWATLWDHEQQKKLSVDCSVLFPKAAVLIAEWMANMSPSLTLSTGLDALSHAMEAFWAKARTPLSQALSLAAIDKIRLTLPRVLQDPKNVSLRMDMCLASLLAGLAFSQTRTTACHSLSYPLTLLHNIPHGYAAALTLSSVMKRNHGVLPEIQQIKILFDNHGGFEAWLRSISQTVQPLRLSAFNISKEHLCAIADLAFTTGRMDNNPISFTRQEAMQILEECL